MYGLIWRLIPGPVPVKLIVVLALIAGAAWLLWSVAFPWIDPYMPFNDGAVDTGAGAGAGAG
ncbi:hypothetical protein J0910_25935 [Nocardiopsis sp. CNT-189]|uniref:hypothetical protein n=1 Tax=Nocardiopsis oceanisediminis TaxID=2816862 RepID=UPI003B38A541